MKALGETIKMKFFDYFFNDAHASRSANRLPRTFWVKFHIDPPLFLGIATVLFFGLLILYSADNQSLILLGRQLLWVCLALGIMFGFAQIPPHRYSQWAPWLFTLGVIML